MRKFERPLSEEGESPRISFRKPVAPAVVSEVGFYQEMRLRDERRREEKALKGQNKQWGHNAGGLSEDAFEREELGVPEWFDG